MKCANCSAPSVYIYAGSGVRSTPYCVTCLPSFARPMAKAGLLQTTQEYARLEQEVAERMQPPVEEPEERIEKPAVRKRKRAVAAAEEVPAEDAPAEIDDQPVAEEA